MNGILAIVQAHMGSKRLPGKALIDICGQSMLQRVVSRVQLCSQVDQVVIATSILAVDDAIEAAAKQMGVRIYRGSDHDVLSRFAKAAEAFDAKDCVRITSDCPLIDPEVSDSIIAAYRGASPKVDYASNKIPQSFPRGLDTEVFSREALQRADQDAQEFYQRTHVTSYIYENPEKFKLLSITSDIDRAHWRWTVDTADDLEFVRSVYGRLGSDSEFSWHDVVNILERQPELMKINENVKQRSMYEG